MWTFGRKIAVGFALSFLLLLAIGGVAYRSIEVLTQTSYLVSHTHTVIQQVEALLGQISDAETGQRGFVITGEDAYLAPYQSAIAEIPVLLKKLHDLTADNTNQQQRVITLEAQVATRLGRLKETIDLRRQSGLEATIKHVQTGEGKRVMDGLRRLTDQIEREERDLLKQRAGEVEAAAGSARSTIVWGTFLALLFVSATGFLLTRSLTQQIASAVQHVQRSSSELQSAANQQAAGARETSTSMSEITTTISELLATSRQIAESTQRVASIAEQTAAAARAGDGKVQLANESTTAIRQQVDLVVNHMLELGRKSQQIGAVLDIVSELAEQTNILAINATIEAAGAGDAGKRFSVVADEIRKLADRVAGSTKEIRVLIDDVRGAVNTTVMATEAGSKAVDLGARQFEQVAAAFQQIASLVGTTTQAAREIELSTKQQTSAVEQVNTAIASTAQATKETEASSGQTSQTASQLAGLSKDLLRLVQAQAAA
ncbi:CHASE3 domain-containing protein [Aquabacterium sp.]|uniref:CHASE3 domain-containing protein n=1 Tax=Aquabacterium sp. TaxID=1872578 RepID=UPI002B5497DD|nr:CHASE3 domain-containing protein [Aquabacterium sp.]HSW08804.1 CHASE3 domain-containing protein [Aquabacterium sp.]